MHTEIARLDQLAELLPEGTTFRFDMRNTTNHWFLKMDYYFILKTDERSDFEAKTVFAWRGHGNKPNLFRESAAKDGLESIRAEVDWGKEVEHAEALAWTDQGVEKDTALLYLFDASGECMGLYAHSLNFTEDIVRVGNSFSDFFDFEKAKAELSAGNVEGKYCDFPRLSLSKEKKKKIKDVLKKGTYEIFDPETGYTMDAEVVQEFIQGKLSELSGGAIKCDEIREIDTGKVLSLEWVVGDKAYPFKVYGETDYLDLLPIFHVANEVLAGMGIEDEFVVYEEDNYGQCSGIAFLSYIKKRRLKKVFGVRVWETHPRE